MPSAFGTYIEPFAGSACLFFAVRPDSAILGDFNADLVHAYQTIRAHPRLVSREVHAWATDTATYYRVRAMSPTHLDDVERAARFTYLNRHAFNGVYRTNRSGQFNVPKGTRAGAIPSEGEFYRNSVALRGATLMVADFEASTSRASAGDFVYLDPPYATARPSHGEYGYGSFGPSDEARLYAVLDDLDRRGVWFLFSYGGEIPRTLRSRWRTQSLSAVRTVGGRVRSRKSTAEYLVANYAANGLG